MKKTSSGFSLTEVLIALALSTVLMAAVIQMFSSLKQTNNFTDESSRIQENGRFALNFISRDIRKIDHWGCVSSDGNILDSTGNFSTFGITAATEGIISNVSSALDAPDGITITGSANEGIPVSNVTESTITVSDASSISAGDSVLISNCEMGEIFTSTSPTSGNTITSNTAIKDPSVYNNTLSSSVFSVSSSSYLIVNNALIVTSNPSTLAGLSDLAVIEALPATRLVIPGIENLQLLYGEDTDNNNVVDYYVPAGTSGLNLANVISIKINLLAQTLNDNVLTESQSFTYNGSTITASDKRIRKNFSATIVLRNRVK
jgi:type IV pilus assembly protein PilW